MNMLRRFALLSALCIASIVLPTASHAAGMDDAKAYIDNVASQALTIIKTEADKSKKQKKLETLFSNSVDIPWVGKFVMGRYWRQATDDQKKHYLEKYQRFLLHHYTSRFTDYTSGSFAITGVEDDSNDEFTVSMALKDDKNKAAEPVLVDYRVRKDGGSFKIFDVIVEGVSMITTQRSEFASVLSKHGVDYLIDQLSKKSVAEKVQ